MVIPISAWASTFIMPIGAYMVRKMHPKLLMSIAALIMLCSILIASFVSKWWLFVLFYGIGYPIGVGLAYWIPIICSWEWFPKRKGIVFGCMCMAFGLGPFIMGFISTALVNPNDEKPLTSVLTSAG